MFREAFMGARSSRRPFAVKPPTLAVNSYEIPDGALGEWLKKVVPDGYVGTYPRVVKTIDGEFVISSNGTAQFVPLGMAPGPSFPI